jgi:hypothetical protein
MVRTRILCLLLFAAARVAAADEAVTSTSTAVAYQAATSTSMPAPTTPATTPAPEGKKHDAKKPAAGRKPTDGNAEPTPATNDAAPPGDVKMSGMSILGNEDAPKSLVIVPWKSSQLADMPSVSRLLDSATQPVDKDVFMRELAYYEFKSGSK